MRAAYRVGDRVRIPLGPRRIPGVIVEDRGPIGVRGQHLYQVLVPMDPFEPVAHEVAEDEIEVAQQSDGNGNTIDTSEAMAFLKSGGLIAILQCNRAGGPRQPRVWLCRDTLGNVTYTFIKERGQVGGETVPVAAVEGDHVFTPSRDEVLHYLRSFGLDQRQAKEVVRSVGTFPL